MQHLRQSLIAKKVDSFTRVQDFIWLRSLCDFRSGSRRWGKLDLYNSRAQLVGSSQTSAVLTSPRPFYYHDTNMPSNDTTPTDLTTFLWILIQHIWICVFFSKNDDFYGFSTDFLIF